MPGFSNFLSVTSDGTTADIDIDTKTQQASHGNVCAVDGTTYDNLASNFEGTNSIKPSRNWPDWQYTDFSTE